ncbi:MAG: 2-C-methyl-D-erythritol 4-phosphate cytidylyltransferase [Holophagales bacterium]|nr:2-C-methyl-D-erythritol 4-phosphate cytidylyltransferase [Holophagales bacterium]
MSDGGRPAGARKLPAGFVFHGVVAAGGRGERFGGETPKQFLELDGVTIVALSVGCLLSAGAESVVVALPSDAPESIREELLVSDKVRIVDGGSTRQASVAAALASSPAAATEFVAVHDGARPATSIEDVLAVVLAARPSGAAILGRSVSDTLKRTAGGRVVTTVDRDHLFRAETPQVFRRELLERAYESARAACYVGTDESSLVERLDGVEIAAVEAVHPNPKLTQPADLGRLRRMLVASGRADA